MSPRPVDVVRQCLEAARRGELDTVRSLLHARVRWHEFDQPESGCQDREQAIAFLERVLDEGGILELEALGELGDQVVAKLRFGPSRDDLTSHVEVFDVEDGHIVRIVIYPPRVEPREPAAPRPAAKLTSTSAVLLVADMHRAVAFYRDRLGFACEVHNDPPDFCVARRDDVSVLLALCENAARIVPNWRLVPNMWDVYVRVDDADALYDEVRERGAPIDYTIYDAPHGFREFGVQDPDGHDVGFGQPIGGGG
jgi:predicted enzyme related to lactoylglutathione lyase